MSAFLASPFTEKMTSSQQWVSMALGDLSHFVVQYYTKV